MAIIPKRLESMAGVTLHSFAAESWIEEAKIRAGMIRGRTRSVSTNTAGRAGRSAAWAGRTWGADQVLVDYWLLTSNVATHEANLSLLEAVFPQDDDDDTGRVWFVIEEEGVEKRALASIERLLPSDQSEHPQRLGHFIGQFSLIDGRWHRAAAESVVAASGTSPLTLSVVGGDAKSEEITLTVKPTATKAAANGERFLFPINLKWPNPWSAHRIPVDVTDGGFNHAGEVTATRSLASGDDLELRNMGLRISRWLASPNTANTKVWGVFDFPAARYWTLRTAALSGDTSFNFTEDLINLPHFPFYCWINNEVLYVTGYNEAMRQFTGATRGQRGTTAAGHSAGDKLYWLPAAQMVDLVSGYTGAAAPDYLDNTIKPMIDLSSSTTGSWVLTQFQEVRTTGTTQDRYPRALSAYTLDVVDRGEDHLYQNYVPWTSTLGADANPASKMGIGYRSAGPLNGHPLQTAWGIRSPVGITQAAYSFTLSLLYYSGAGAREGRLLVTSIDSDGYRTVVRTIAKTSGSPPLSGSFTDAISPSAREVRWEFDPYRYQPTEPTDNEGFEITAVTLTLATAEKVGVLFGARQNAYEFGRPAAPMTIANSDGKTLKLNMVVLLNDTISINVGSRSVTTPDGVGHSNLATGDWPYLPPGTHNYTLTEANSGTLELAASSYRKGWN